MTSVSLMNGFVDAAGPISVSLRLTGRVAARLVVVSFGSRSLLEIPS